MTAHEPFDLGQFLASFKNFMDKAVEQARVEEPETLFLSKLRTHFGTDAPSCCSPDGQLGCSNNHASWRACCNRPPLSSRMST